MKTPIARVDQAGAVPPRVRRSVSFLFAGYDHRKEQPDLGALAHVRSRRERRKAEAVYRRTGIWTR
jgi:hypothetical protein